jgi:hypothetical protein
MVCWCGDDSVSYAFDHSFHVDGVSLEVQSDVGVEFVNSSCELGCFALALKNVSVHFFHCALEGVGGSATACVLVSSVSCATTSAVRSWVPTTIVGTGACCACVGCTVWGSPRCGCADVAAHLPCCVLRTLLFFRVYLLPVSVLRNVTCLLVTLVTTPVVPLCPK